jgi:hypothetical protein
MGARGPKSARDLLTPSVADLRGDARPEPLEDLTEEQAAEWRGVVERLPATGSPVKPTASWRSTAVTSRPPDASLGCPRISRRAT